MADNKINLPSSGGGIVRYDENQHSKIHIAPQQVIVIIAVFILLELILHMFGKSFFGM